MQPLEMESVQQHHHHNAHPSNRKTRPWHQHWEGLAVAALTSLLLLVFLTTIWVGVTPAVPQPKPLLQGEVAPPVTTTTSGKSSSSSRQSQGCGESVRSHA